MEKDPKTEYEAKKQAKEQERQKEIRKTRTKRASKTATRWTAGIIILAAIGYGLFWLVQTAGPQGEDFSTAYPTQGRDHIAEGENHTPYNSNPPSSGPHYTTTVDGGFYESPLPDERVVHNLEHGDIWITYHPNISDSAKEALREFAGRYTVVSPRPENEGDISLVAWGRVDTFDLEGDSIDQTVKIRIRDFISRYDNRGPENVRGLQTERSF